MFLQHSAVLVFLRKTRLSLCWRSRKRDAQPPAYVRIRRITRAQSVKPVFSHPRSKLHTAPRSILETPSPRGDPARTGHIYLRRAPAWKNARSLADSIESLSSAGMTNTVNAHPAQPATRRSDLHCTCCGGALALPRTLVKCKSGPPLPTLALGRSAKRALHRASRAARSARRLRRPHHQEATRASARRRQLACWRNPTHTLGGLCLLANSNNDPSPGPGP